ncbi:MAG: indolepyruvate ferredoxin oxidoreductase subunit alpha [Christensenellales bacterium]
MKLLLGNEAIALGALHAGVKAATAYPGTPSTEITETIAKYSQATAQWSVNEKVALETAIGVSIAGARAICSMKHVGLNVAADPLFTVSYTGVNGGLVICVADDPGMHSSQNEQDTRMLARAAYVPVLEPSDSQEAYDFTRLAFELSEQYDTPVIVRLTTRVSHSQGAVIEKEPLETVLKEYQKDAGKYVMMPAMGRARQKIVYQRMARLQEDACSMDINRMEVNSCTGMITSGIAYQYVKEALPGASVLKLGLTNPLPEKLIREFSSKVERLFIIEELGPVIEEQVKAMGIPCIGKEILPSAGELSANLLAEKIGGQITCSADAQQAPVRPPVLCPGCPHRGVYYVLNKLKLHVFGDIGCYTLGALPPLSALDTTICMGASIGTAAGAEKARGRDFARKSVAVIGDSTFLHSGVTSLMDVVYNNANTTVLILDNLITGMTGHQQNPATGKNIYNQPAPKIDLETLVRALGVSNVSVVDPFNLQETEQVLRTAVASDGPSVVICRRPCALLEKKAAEPYRVRQELCKKCNTCLKLGCPAIEKKTDAIEINASLCNGCGLCVTVCPFKAIAKAGE